MTNDLDEDYRQAGFGHRLGFGRRPALILIDFVAGYYLRESPLYTETGYAIVQSALESALRVRTAAHEANIPVILTDVKFTPAERESMLMFRKAPAANLFDHGSTLADLAPGLTPTADEIVITKHFPSAFFATSLASMLTAKGVDSLIITGLSTSGCVRATCLDTLCHGFIPIVVEQAVGDRDRRPHEANLFDMGNKMADVVSEQEVVAYLGGLGRA